MKVLMISTDKNVFRKNSEARQRMIEYGSLVDELHIIILSRKLFQPESRKMGNVFLYITDSKNRLFYVFDAIKIGGKILADGGKWLITTQDVFETGLVGWRLAKKFKSPWQAQIHTDFLSSYFKKESTLNKFLFCLGQFLTKRANCVRVVSERIKKSLLYAFQISPSKITTLPIFVDVEKIKRAPVKTDLRKNYPQFDFIVLMASRLTEEKNILLAIDAMSEIIKQRSKAGLIIVGSGPEEKKLKLKVKNQGLEINVKFEDWTDNLPSYYKTSDLFLLTSNYEGYGRTVVEAMTSGCVVITTDVGLAGEFVKNGENGLITPVGDKKSIIESVLKIIKNKDFREMLRKGALSAVACFKTKEQYLDDYKKSWQTCGF